MTEHQELVPVPQPDEPSSGSRGTWQRLLDDLQRERDELRVRLHLARKELADEMAGLDARLEELKAKSQNASREAGKAMEDIDDSARQLWNEIKEGFERVRRSFSE
jgi:chromosome segregation ATPase